jgi:hypothetical protein
VPPSVAEPNSYSSAPPEVQSQTNGRSGSGFWDFLGGASQLYLNLQGAGAFGKGSQGASSEKKNYKCSWGPCTLAQWQQEKANQVPVPPLPPCNGTGTCGVGGQK